MTSLTMPSDPNQPESDSVLHARENWQARWEASMTRHLDGLRQQLLGAQPALLAYNTGAELTPAGIRFPYWGRFIQISLPDLIATYVVDGSACNLFDAAVLLHYLSIADGTALADRWVGFRELPGGGFYHQAFQGYTGDRLARVLQANPAGLLAAAGKLSGLRLTGLGEFAFAFQPLPRIPLAAIFWPGDEEFPGRSSILFDAEACHYMTLDGLAILGARLVSKLIANLPAHSPS